MNPEEREAFETTGYLVLERVLEPSLIERLGAAIDRLVPEIPRERRLSYDRVNEPDILGRDDAFLELVDHPAILPRIAALLGWNVWVNHTHFNVNPPTPPRPPGTRFRHIWHRDGGVMSWDMKRPVMLGIKVAFYLTDLQERGVGNTWIVPGSHRFDERTVAVPEPEAELADAAPVCVPAGSAILFHPAVIHSAHTPNDSSLTRKAIFVQWAYRWLQPVDAQTVGHLEPRIADPIRRQMLGLTYAVRGAGQYSPGTTGRYYPTAAEVPLRAKMIDWGLPVGGWVVDDKR